MINMNVKPWHWRCMSDKAIEAGGKLTCIHGLWAVKNRTRMYLWIICLVHQCDWLNLAHKILTNKNCILLLFFCLSQDFRLLAYVFCIWTYVLCLVLLFLSCLTIFVLFYYAKIRQNNELPPLLDILKKVVLPWKRIRVCWKEFGWN